MKDVVTRVLVGVALWLLVMAGLACTDKTTPPPDDKLGISDSLFVRGKSLTLWRASMPAKLKAAIPGRRGELTGDGFVDVLDAVVVAQFYDGRKNLDVNIMPNTETNCDGMYGRNDLLHLVDFLNSVGIGVGNGVPDSMPCF